MKKILISFALLSNIQLAYGGELVVGNGTKKLICEGNTITSKLETYIKENSPNLHHTGNVQIKIEKDGSFSLFWRDKGDEGVRKEFDGDTFAVIQSGAGCLLLNIE